MTNQVEPPKDNSLLFLVYGIFKPKYISKIKLTESKSLEIQNNNFIKDIVPLKTKSGNNKNDSYLIYFKEEHSKEA